MRAVGGKLSTASAQKGDFMGPTEHFTDPPACGFHMQPREQPLQPCCPPGMVQLVFGDGHSAHAEGGRHEEPG